MPLRQQSPEGFVGLAGTPGHGIEHKQRGGICRLVVVDDHLNARFVHALLPPLPPQEHAWVRPGTAAFGPGPLRQPAGDIPPMEKATTLRLTLLRLALGNTTQAFSAVPTLPQSGS